MGYSMYKGSHDFESRLYSKLYFIFFNQIVHLTKLEKHRTNLKKREKKTYLSCTLIFFPAKSAISCQTSYWYLSSGGGVCDLT